MRPVGVVRGSRSAATDDHWLRESAEIVLDERFAPESLAGLDSFSHVQVLFLMHGVREDEVELEARHPRNRADWPKVGIFAQRAKRRPNRIGLTTCRILGIEGRRLRVEGLDAIDGTPVLDLKPWVRQFAPAGETVSTSVDGRNHEGLFLKGDKARSH